MKEIPAEPDRSGKGAGKALVLLLVVLPAVLFAPSLFAPFLYDDLHSIQRNPHLNLGNALEFFCNPGLFDENPRTRMYRPVLLLTYAVDDLLWGRRPLGFHLTNLVLHLGVGLVLYGLLRALFRARWGVESPWWACLGALAFLVHPLATEGVVYVSCRSSQLATLGVLGALLGYVRARQCRDRGRRLACFGLAWILAAVALGSKAIAVTLPVALILVEMWAFPPRPFRIQEPGRVVLALVPFFLLAGGYLLLRQEVMGSTGVNLTAQRFYATGHELTGGRSVQSNLFTQAAVFWHYLALVAWPVHLNIAHHVPVAHHLSETRVWISILGLALYLGAAIVLLRKRTFLALTLVWLPLTLSPTSSIIPLNVVMSEHRLYLPLTLFLAGIVTVGVRQARRKDGRLPAPVLGLVVAVLGLWSVRAAWRQFDYLDARRLWGKAVALAPDNFRARNYLGNALVACGDLGGARDQYRAAHALYPGHVDTRINLGEVNLRLADAGKDQEAGSTAERLFRGVIEEEPRHVLARLKLGRLLWLRGKSSGARPEDMAAAKMEFRTVLDMARNTRFREVRVWAWARLADLHEHLGNLEEAARDLKSILREVPERLAVHERLAALYEKMGRPDRARRHRLFLPGSASPLRP